MGFNAKMRRGVGGGPRYNGHTLLTGRPNECIKEGLDGGWGRGRGLEFSNR